MKKILFLFLLLVSTVTFSQPNYVPTSGLVGYWPFTGNTTCSNTTSLNVTVTNSTSLTTDRSGTANTAYNFLGLSSTSYMSVPTNTSLSLTNMTLSVWFKSSQVTSQTDPNQGILGRGNSSSEGYGLVYSYLDTDNIKYAGFYIRQNSSNFSFVKIPTASLPLSTESNWTHMVGSYDGVNMRLYINGILVNTLNTSTIPTTSGSLYFGKNKFDGVNFQGKIDDIGIWNRALTQNEVTNLFYSNVPDPVYYKWVTQPGTSTTNNKYIYRYVFNNINEYYRAIAYGVRLYRVPYSSSSIICWSNVSSFTINGDLRLNDEDNGCGVVAGCDLSTTDSRTVLMEYFVDGGYDNYVTDYQPSFSPVPLATPNIVLELINDYVRLNPTTHTTSYYMNKADRKAIMTSLTPTLDNDTFTPETNKISVYPNPCSNTLNINTNETVDRLTVVDITGKTVLTQSNTQSVNVETLTNGVYFLTTYINGTAYQNKFIKN